MYHSYTIKLSSISKKISLIKVKLLDSLLKVVKVFSAVTTLTGSVPKTNNNFLKHGKIDQNNHRYQKRLHLK